MTLKELRSYIDSRIAGGEFTAEEPVYIELANGGRTENVDDLLIFVK